LTPLSLPFETSLNVISAEGPQPVGYTWFDALFFTRGFTLIALCALYYYYFNLPGAGPTSSTGQAFIPEVNTPIASPLELSDQMPLGWMMLFCLFIILGRAFVG
jgi:hypothetical protein